MKITEYLANDLIILGMNPADKQQTITMIVDHLVAKGKIHPDRRSIIIDKMREREELSSTGIGGGVAIPHAAGENINGILVALGQIPEGVDFGSIDGEPVHLIFMIIGSNRVPRVHLQLLAMIVKICKNRELINKLISADSVEAAYGLITAFDDAGVSASRL